MYRTNTLKQRLRNGEKVLGCWSMLGHPTVVEILALAGFDYIVLDHEHGVGSPDTLAAQLQAMSATPAVGVVRVPWNDHVYLKRVLDAGAEAVLIPTINTADEARAAVDAVKYGPEGHRGIFSGGRPAGYGFKGGTADYAREANRQTLVCLMLEEVEAIENLPEMVKVPGVDVYFIGSGDLSQSMGYTGQQAHPEVQKLMERGVATITGAGRIAGCSCPDNLIPKFLGLGVQYFHSTVSRLLQHGSNAYLEKARAAAAAAGK